MKRNYYLGTLLFFFLFGVPKGFAEYNKDKNLTITAQNPDCDLLEPVVETTEIDLCVPGGNVTLNATNSTYGDELYWYDSDDEFILKGEELDVGVIEETTSYWVTEGILERRDKEGGQGKIKPTSTSTLASGNGLTFEVTAEYITLHSVDVYPAADGNLEISIMQGKDVLHVHSESVKASLENPVTINLGFEIPKGKLYRIVQTSSPAIAMIRDSDWGSNSFPYDLGKDKEFGRISAGHPAGDLNKAITYFYFYNWEIEGPAEVVCESDKKEIVINVNDYIPPAPEIDEIYTFCGSETFTLADIEFSGELEGAVQWFDEEGDDIDAETIAEEGVTYLVAQTVGGCASEWSEVTVEYLELSDLPEAETEQNYEEGETLEALDVTGENLRWYADADKDEELNTDTSMEDGETYYVTQTKEDLCESEVLGITVTEILSVEDVVFQGLKFMPNPVKDVLYLTNNEEIQSVALYDLLGRKLTTDITYLQGTEVKVNFGDFTPGVYLLRIEVNGKQKALQIMKR